MRLQNECRVCFRAASFAVLLVLACLFSITCAVFGPSATAYAEDEEGQTAVAFEYDGDDVDFFAFGGKPLGMYGKQAGSWFEYQNGKIVVEHVTKNTTIYAGFYVDADFDDPTTWDKFIACNEGGWLSFELDPSYAGMAWPIAPVQHKDPTKTTSMQYYMGVPPLEKIPGYLLEVTFTDGEGKELQKATVVSGEDAVPPEVEDREGLIFGGWDKPYTNITEDTVLNAVWLKEGEDYFTVTFVDGWKGSTLKKQHVVKGGGADAPDEPKREGFTFIGWDRSFDNITKDLEVAATWRNDDEIALEAAHKAIEELPDDPPSVLGDTGNEAVASAVAAYSALKDALKSQISDDEVLHLAKCAIAILPRDAYLVGAEHEVIIADAESIVGSLSDNLQSKIDSDILVSSSSYGRNLENAAWALDALADVNSGTSLKSGTYTGKVVSTLNRGKSTSRRDTNFWVSSVIVDAGKATAVIEANSDAPQTLRIGGIEYANLANAKECSRFEIPIRLNSTFHFSVMGKGAVSGDTVANAYEMTVEADESSMTPDAKTDEGKNSGSSENAGSKSSGSSGKNPAGSGAAAGKGSSTTSKSSGSSALKSNSASSPKGSGNSSGSESSDSSSKSTDSSPTGSNSSANKNSSPSGSTGNAQSTRSTSTRTSSAGNLSSLLRTSSTQSSSSASASKSSASASSASSSSKSKDAANAKGADKDKDKDKGDVRVQEVGLASSDGQSDDDVDMSPAIAGGVLLSISLGMLAFILRFVKRETVFS